ncbi:hypothetical protein [Hyphomicrobium sp. MC8b]|uniref:hypothetical protein n=1 Tax=Hyphomicrobium sp. MC8b TaxID=300273 RepID=UPI00391C5DFF
MQSPAPLPMSAAEEAHLKAVIDKLERQVALTRSGSGGVAQLRRMFLDEISALKNEIARRPRAVGVEAKP